MFHFRGELLPSKSWLNRAQVIQYFNPQLQLHVDAAADDVRFLQRAIAGIPHNTDFDLGLGGTSFRFFSFLISRKPGDWTVRAHERLLERPQEDLARILEQLGVAARFTSAGLRLSGQGWRIPSEIEVSAGVSSQFLSGLLLSAWNLPDDLKIKVRKPVASESYLRLTCAILAESGMRIAVEEHSDFLYLTVFREQRCAVETLNAELDVSSAFALLAAAAVNGEAEITNWKPGSSQPDMDFVRRLGEMGIRYETSENTFRIRRQSGWTGLCADLGGTPDLFPVLAVLCALGRGESVLSGATQLRHKESDRIAKTAELLTAAGFRVQPLQDGMKVHGGGAAGAEISEFVFDPAHDHRMAMAAGVLKLAGYPIRILHPEVVNKSYPGFWNDTGIQP